MSRILTLFALLASLIAAPALADPVEPEKAFPLSARALTTDTVELRFDIRKGYYLYDDKLGFAAASEGVTLGTAEVPPGQTYKDEFFGDTEIHRGRLTILVPVSAPAGVSTVDIEVKSQGCWDGGICYPPETRTVSVDLAAPPGAAGGPRPPRQPRATRAAVSPACCGTPVFRWCSPASSASVCCWPSRHAPFR
jgi:thioredoxin:protein disulfide reductase